jgi:hypothetical protein
MCPYYSYPLVFIFNCNKPSFAKIIDIVLGDIVTPGYYSGLVTLFGPHLGHSIPSTHLYLVQGVKILVDQ